MVQYHDFNTPLEKRGTSRRRIAYNLVILFQPNFSNHFQHEQIVNKLRMVFFTVIRFTLRGHLHACINLCNTRMVFKFVKNNFRV